MASVVAICNEALGLLGASFITDLSDSSNEAVLCNRFYETSRDCVIRDGGYWNSSKAEAALSPLSTTPIMGWSYEYLLPSNLLRILKVQNTGGNLLEYEIRGKKLLADESGIEILYAKKITDPNDYDSLLYTAVVFYLAYMISYAIRRDVKVTAELFRAYQIHKDLAMSMDAQEGQAKFQAQIEQPLASQYIQNARFL